MILYELYCNLISFSLNFVAKVPYDIISASIQVVALHEQEKLLPKPMMTNDAYMHCLPLASEKYFLNA